MGLRTGNSNFLHCTDFPRHPRHKKTGTSPCRFGLFAWVRSAILWCGHCCFPGAIRRDGLPGCVNILGEHHAVPERIFLGNLRRSCRCLRILCPGGCPGPGQPVYLSAIGKGAVSWLHFGYAGYGVPPLGGSAFDQNSGSAGLNALKTPAFKAKYLSIR